MAAPQTIESGREAPLPNRPKVPGKLGLRARSRAAQPPDSGRVRVLERAMRWDVAQTAIIICDMWDTHTCGCRRSAWRAMAPRMNQVVSAARSLGVMIIHSPSDTMKFYEGTLAAADAAGADGASPLPILARCAAGADGGAEFPDRRRRQRLRRSDREERDGAAISVDA